MKIQEYHVLLFYPLSSTVNLIYQNGTKASLSLKEDVYSQDPTSNQNEIPTFNGYSNSGHVEGEVIFCK